MRPDATGSWELRSLAPAGDTGLVEPGHALRVSVETPGTRFVYTFWYRLMEPPREDAADTLVAVVGRP